MPNWCSNYMTIEGPKDKIKDLIDKITAAKTGDAEANMAAVTKKDTNDYDGNTYLFSIQDLNREEIESPCSFTFETRWSPLCDEVMVDASRAYPDLRFAFNYEECGEPFRGYDEIKNGEWILRQYFEGEQFIDSEDAIDFVMKSAIEDLPGMVHRFDPDGDDPEYYCPTAFAILKARLNGEEITEENFPQLFMKEA